MAYGEDGVWSWEVYLLVYVLGDYSTCIVGVVGIVAG